MVPEHKIAEKVKDFFNKILLQQKETFSWDKKLENKNIYLMDNQRTFKKEQKRLIENTVNINEKDKKGTYLIIQAAKNYPYLIELIIQKGVDVNVYDKKGKTALMYMAEKNHKSVKAKSNGDKNYSVIEFFNFGRLLNAGIDVNHMDNSGKTALDYVIQKARFNYILPLIKAGANINAKNKEGETLLMIMWKIDKSNFLELLKYNPDLDIKNSEGKTILNIVRKSNYSEIYQTLKKYEAYAKIQKQSKELKKIFVNEKVKKTGIL